MVKQRFDELEGLRGIAAVAVVVYHFLIAFYLYSFMGPGSGPQNSRFEDNIYGAPFMGVFSGLFAVSVFFVISGFVLSIGFFQTKDLTIIKKLAAKRYLRLMLPALASTILCFIIIICGISKIQEVAAVTHSAWLAGAWTFTPTLFDALKSGTVDIFTQGSSPFNNVLWTMTAEFAGSFLIFGFLAMFGKLKNRWIGYAFLGIATFNTWFFPFIAGMVLADMYNSGRIKTMQRSWKVIAPLLIVALVLAGYPLVSVDNTLYQYITISGLEVNWLIIYLPIAAILLTFLILYASQLNRLFKVRWVSRLGKYTFSLYLTHLIVLYTFSMAVFYLLDTYLSLSYAANVFITIASSIPVLVVATVLFEKYIDSTSIKVSSAFARLMLDDKYATRVKRRFMRTARKRLKRIKVLINSKKRQAEISEAEIAAD